jgi:DNA invertase Pin-like site-specific DNA recombinase
MVIARDMHRAGAGLRFLAEPVLAEPVLDTTGDFVELVLAMLDVAAKLERRRIAERAARASPTPRRRARGHRGLGFVGRRTPHSRTRERLPLREGRASVVS